MLIEILVIGALSAAAIAYFWNDIRERMLELATWVEEKFDKAVAQDFREFITMLDEGAVFVRKSFKEGYQWFQSRVLRSRSIYEKTENSDKVKRTSETIVQEDSGKFRRIREESEVAWEDLPSEVRKTFMTSRDRTDEIDDRDFVLKRAEEKARQNGMVLEH